MFLSYSPPTSPLLISFRLVWCWALDYILQGPPCRVLMCHHISPPAWSNDVNAESTVLRPLLLALPEALGIDQAPPHGPVEVTQCLWARPPQWASCEETPPAEAGSIPRLLPLYVSHYGSANWGVSWSKFASTCPCGTVYIFPTSRRVFLTGPVQLFTTAASCRVTRG
jgi:hypothetical protein